MSTTIVLTLGPGKTFSRSKLQSMPSYKKQSINNLLDKIETIYQKLLPGKSKIIWLIYCLLLTLFLLSGIVKNLSHNSENEVPRASATTADSVGRRTRLLQSAHPQVSQVPASTKKGSKGDTPMAASDMNMHLEEGPAVASYEATLERLEANLGSDLKKGMYFLLEVFFIVFPFYYLWSRYRKQVFVLALVKDLVEIENRQLITTCQFKIEISEISVITIVQFDADGYQSNLERSTSKLVWDKRLPSKKGSIQASGPVMSI